MGDGAADSLVAPPTRGGDGACKIQPETDVLRRPAPFTDVMSKSKPYPAADLPRSSGSRALGRALRPVLLGVTIVVVVIIAVLTGRTLLEKHYEESRSYQNLAAIPAHNDLFVLPAWAPSDATDITINVQTKGKGRSFQLATASTGIPKDCQQAVMPNVKPVPALSLHVKDSGYRCNEWFAILDGKRLSAWTAYK